MVDAKQWAERGVQLLSDLDHEWFGCWLDVGPSMYDQYQTDTGRLAHTLHCIKGYREAVRAMTGEEDCQHGNGWERVADDRERCLDCGLVRVNEKLGRL